MRVCVGRIRKPHGVNGLVIIEPYTHSSSFFTQEKDNRVFYTNDGVGLFLFEPRIAKDCIISGLVGYKDRTSVERFINEELYVDRDSLPDTEEDEYYFEDLKNMKVLDSNQEIGTVTNVGDYGAGVFLEIKTINGQIGTIQFDKQSILSIDIKKMQIIIDPAMLLL